MHLGHTLESTSDTAQTPVRGWGRPSSSVCLIPASPPLGPRSPESPTVPQRGHATSHRWASTGKSLCLECSRPVGRQENILENDACLLAKLFQAPLHKPVAATLLHLCGHAYIIHALEMTKFALLWVEGRGLRPPGSNAWRCEVELMQ